MEIHENINDIEYLIESAISEIKKNEEIIDYEFILEILICLLKFEDDYYKLTIKEKSLFELILTDFNKFKKVLIKQNNNNEYNKIINIIEKYRDNIKEKNILLNLDIFILIYYHINIRRNFINYLKNITYKEEIINYMIIHPSIFTKYNCSDMEYI